MTLAALPAMIRPLIEPRVPPGVDVRWFRHKEEATEFAAGAEIGWFDMPEKADMLPPILAASAMKWLNSIYAGVDGMPLDLLAERGTIYTNGAGINAITIAEWVVMGMLTVAKGYREIVRAQDRHEWLAEPPGRVELAGNHALLIGAGAIGSLVTARLAAFDVRVTTGRRTPGPGELGPEDWRARLGEFDWVILAVPATAETDAMIGAAELAAMKPSATLINIARGAVVDQDALVAALASKAIGAAFLDVTTPEPLPPGHPLWALPNAHVTMHLSGQSQDRMFVRAADRFIDNLARYLAGQPLTNRVDLRLGY